MRFQADRKEGNGLVPGHELLIGQPGETGEADNLVSVRVRNDEEPHVVGYIKTNPIDVEAEFADFPRHVVFLQGVRHGLSEDEGFGHLALLQEL